MSAKNPKPHSRKPHQRNAHQPERAQEQKNPRNSIQRPTSNPADPTHEPREAATSPGALGPGAPRNNARPNPNRPNPNRPSAGRAATPAWAPLAGRAATPAWAPLAGRAVITVLGIVVVCLFVRASISLLRNPQVYDVTLNGTPHRVHAGATIQTLLDDGSASPTPGNLVAVDGSVLEEGKGNAFLATVNGEKTTDASTPLTFGAQVQIDNGSDVTEDYTEKTSEIPFETNSAEATKASYFYGPFHIYSQGVAGEQVTRTGKVSGTEVTEVTRNPISAGYDVYKSDVGDQKLVALTFDDGPWSTTGDLLDVLKENGAHATFFTIGNQISTYPDAVKRAYEEGNQICTHTWDHAAGSGQGVNLTYMSAEEQVNEVEKGFKAIDDLVGAEVPRIFRAPGGNYYGETVTNLDGHVIAEIGWDVDTEDWRRPGADHIVKMIESVQPGQVILMHDGGGDRSQTIEALKTALPYLKEQGYEFVTIDELMKAGRGVTRVN